MDQIRDEMLKKLTKICSSVNNNNKLQTIKKESPNMWAWIKAEANRLYPNYAPSDKELLFLVLNDNIQLTCECGKTKKYYNGKYWCSKSCPVTKLTRKTTLNKKYGVDYYSQSTECKEKVKKTVTKKYGVSNISRSTIIKDKKKNTVLKNFGCEFPMQHQSIKNKRIQTYLEKYGVDSPVKSTEIQNKIKQTNIQRYGAACPLQAENIKFNICQKNIKNFGTPYPQQSDIIKNKVQKTNLEKYNRLYIAQRNYSAEANEILNDKTKFSEELTLRGVNNLSDWLKVSQTTIYRRHKQFDLDIIKSGGTSMYEEILSQWFKNNNIQFSSKDRKIIAPLELDFYLPDFNIAIEFDGLYWHSEDAGKDKFYHAHKSKLCNEKGIRLIHIFEDEWVKSEEICLDILSRLLKINQQKIMARKCELVEFSNGQVKQFLEKNHLQGYTSASINLGLMYENQLVQLITFKHPRYNNSVEWEIIRQANKLGVQVIGGLQKLWSYFLKKWNPTSVISYCDLRWFIGTGYEKLGFTLKYVSKPVYWYINGTKRLHRSNFTKKKCVKLASNLEDIAKLNQLTEKIIAREILNLNKIWDCGQQVWIWNKI